jgi:adenine-specific DNA-methyltransferase
MSKYPKVNFIGNKQKLVDWIADNLPIKGGIAVDLFCGGSSVSYKLKQLGFEVFSNDSLYSNFVLSKAIIENPSVTLRDDWSDMNPNADNVTKTFHAIDFLVDKLYFEKEVKELAGIIEIAKLLPEYEKFMLMSLIRRAMIRKLPYSRMNLPWAQIQKLRDEEYSYHKYKRKRAYHNLSFKELIHADLENYNSAVFDNGLNCKSSQKDAFEFIKTFDKMADIIYIDPPYPKTMNKYDAFYGQYDDVFKKKISYVDMSKDDDFVEKMDELIALGSRKTRYIVISQNNKTIPSATKLAEKFKKYGKISIIKKQHQYKVTGSVGKNSTLEILLIIKVKRADDV